MINHKNDLNTIRIIIKNFIRKMIVLYSRILENIIRRVLFHSFSYMFMDLYGTYLNLNYFFGLKMYVDLHK